MSRLVLIVVIGIVVWFMIKGLGKPRRGARPDAPPAAKSDDIVKCSECGVHIPKAEAALQGGAYRCADAVACLQQRDRRP